MYRIGPVLVLQLDSFAAVSIADEIPCVFAMSDRTMKIAFSEYFYINFTNKSTSIIESSSKFTMVREFSQFHRINSCRLSNFLVTNGLGGKCSFKMSLSPHRF